MPDDATRAALLKASKPPPKALFSTLITANHILHHHNVVDAYGHISVRNPQNPATFFISKSQAPALVTSREDLEEYFVEDAAPVNKNAPKGYAERFIHSELYKQYKGVNSVVHAHSEAVLPFGISSVPLRPVFHIAGVMGAQCPIYDISLHYKSSDPHHSLLVNAAHLGASLAHAFNPSTTIQKTTTMIKNYMLSTTASPPDFPSSPVVLMRGHGLSCVGDSIEEAVYRAVYTCANARVQTTALMMQGAYNVGLVAEHFGNWDVGGGEKGSGPKGQAKQEGLHFLNEREVKDTATVLKESVERPWGMWCAEVQRSGLYRNEMEVPDEAEEEEEGEE